jgi:aryl-alcohol dehydrogenase-like predicted oxidoreductase
VPLKLLHLRRSDLRVSEYCLGTMNFGTALGSPESVELLDHYWEHGGNFIDTANMYAHWLPGGTGGESESVIGRWQQSRAALRDRIVVATKVGFAYPGTEKRLRQSDIEAEGEKSLRRLRTDHIDIYYAHGDDEETPLEETLGAFERLVQSGKIRQFALSNFCAPRLEYALTLAQQSPCCVQQSYSLIPPRTDATLPFSQQYATSEIHALCESYGLPLVAHSVFLKGYYADSSKELPEHYDRDRANHLSELLCSVSREVGAKVNQVLLSYLRSQPCTVIPVLGVSSIQQLSEALCATEVQLQPAQIAHLNSAIATHEPK